MKITFKYDNYWDYETMTEKLEELKALYPEVISLESLGKTKEDKSVWAVTLSKGDKDPKDKPAFYIDGNIHAGEVTGSMCAMYVIDALCTGNNEEDIDYLLRNYTYYVLPKLTPDGSDYYLHTANKLRSVNKVYPKEAEKGLVAKDMDGDGVIRLMRFKSNQGAWKISKENPRLMEGRLPQDLKGPFYHVVTEGEVKGNFSLGLVTNKSPWGYDFNRNFPFGWYDEKRQPGSGEYPLVHDETKLMADFILSHPNIGFVNALHTSGGVFIYPPGTYSASEAHQKDMEVFKRMGAYAKECTGYNTENVFDAFLADTKNYSSGAFDDWCYESQGIPAFTIELWDAVIRSGVSYDDYRKSMKPSFENVKIYEKQLKWVEQNCVPGCYKDWEVFNHPQLGEVEIGGFDFKFTLQNPPESFLLQEVEKVGKYLIDSAACLPKLVIEDTQVLEIGQGLYKISVSLSNSGYLPTYLTEKAKENGKAQPIKANLLGEVECVSEKELETDFLAGFGAVSTGYGYDGITSDGTLSPVQVFDWYVKGRPGQEVEIEISQEKAGKELVSLSL